MQFTWHLSEEKYHMDENNLVLLLGIKKFLKEKIEYCELEKLDFGILSNFFN